ncbi:hypothetical protein TNCV_3479291 [Trichonephila clavipes]|nr:hypothetical protein TNCV_3479291 [Trichonephila clavipes]
MMKEVIKYDDEFLDFWQARQCFAHLATSHEIDGQTKRCFIKCTDPDGLWEKLPFLSSKEVPDAIRCEAPDQSVVSQQYSHSQFELGSFLEKKANSLAQSPQLGEVHLLWHNQRRPHEEQAGQKVKDEQEVQHQQELVYTSKML